MTKRPHSVTIISWLFVATGMIGLAYHLPELNAERPFEYETVWVLLVRLLAMVCGAFMLRGRNWARWGLIVWMMYHIILSAFHSRSELIIHTLLFAVIAYFLFRPQASAYFRASSAELADLPKDDLRS